MNKLHTHLQNETTHIRLSDAEKSAMRARLEEVMRAMPAQPMPAYTPSPYAWILLPRSLALSAFALLLIISTSTAYAAEGSLPGGTLYPVKVSVIEPLKVALATSPAAKAQVNADIATVRVREAQILAVQGKLTPQTAQEISENYSRHAAEALALAEDSDAALGIVASTTVLAVAPQVAPVPEEDDTYSKDEEAPALSMRVNTMQAIVATKKAALAAPTTTMPVPQATSTHSKVDTRESFSKRMHASLEEQADILHSLHIDVRAQNKNRRD
ncbi:MAG: DUF5667 domain-containing protein [Candidatus Adlerbacteria bacterium]|nr:DUF5667 domain-containing protein [Candidatus Adlerbacteria bacterium]